jgi:hypothetical protein
LNKKKKRREEEQEEEQEEDDDNDDGDGADGNKDLYKYFPNHKPKSHATCIYYRAGK